MPGNAAGKHSRSEVSPSLAARQQEISTSLDKVLMRHQSKELKTEARFQYACTFLCREILNFLILEWEKTTKKTELRSKTQFGVKLRLILKYNKNRTLLERMGPE